MDLYTLVQVAWPCLRDRYPELAGAALQVIGGATVFFRLLGSAKIGATSESHYGIGKLLTVLGKIALNKR